MSKLPESSFPMKLPPSPFSQSDADIILNDVLGFNLHLLKNARKVIDCRKDWCLAFTKTYTPSTLTSFKPKFQFEATVKKLTSILDKGGISYVLFPEYTLSGIIHYHGVLKINDKFKYAQSINELRRDGFINVKMIDNVDAWIDYILKEWPSNAIGLGIDYPPNNVLGNNY